jgi:predicted DNA repair protein MutK
MAGLTLLALLDDIVAVLDDVALMSKVAAKKTAGVLGDDLALNAQQVSGVKPEREIPVVWAVAKGSLLNKVIIVPIALALSVFMPVAIVVLLIIGGLYLCYEGVEKVVHSLFSTHETKASKQQHIKANADDKIDLVALEKDKIKGAIRTDFILSAEIIVIALGTLSEVDFLTQTLVLVALSIGLTGFVYGFVAAIVKMDDLGLYLINRSAKDRKTIQSVMGHFLLSFAPLLMKFLVIVGTIAMFLVGGGIIEHNIPIIGDYLHHIEQKLALVSHLFEYIAPTALSAIVGIVAGALCLLLVNIGTTFFLPKK